MMPMTFFINETSSSSPATMFIPARGFSHSQFGHRGEYTSDHRGVVPRIQSYMTMNSSHARVVVTKVQGEFNGQ